MKRYRVVSRVAKPVYTFETFREYQDFCVCYGLDINLMFSITKQCYIFTSNDGIPTKIDKDSIFGDFRDEAIIEVIEENT